MKILVLGGTVFLGRHLTEAALVAGHEVVHFNRGQTAPDLFAGVETVVGDRAADLDRLAGRSFDAVVDTSGFDPAVVAASATRLAGETERYVFVSSVSAYADLSTPGVNESATLATIPAAELAEATRKSHYGGLKALCEREVETVFGDRALVVRPGLIVGPYDPTGRFSYWPHRIARGGEVLAPGAPEDAVQVIDARDLAGWLVSCVEGGRTGVYNAVGPASPLTLGSLLDVCRAVAGSDARITWVDEDFLLENDVEPWSELPLWIPAALADFAGLDRIDGSRAFAAGLVPRPVEETVAATLAEKNWARGSSLKTEREVELLRAWHGRER